MESTSPPVIEHPDLPSAARHDTSVADESAPAADSPLTESLQQPPHYVTRGLVYLLLAMVVVGLVYCAVGEVDVIREASAVVVPEGHLKNLQSDCDGVVNKVAVREGDEVKAGQVLAVVDSREVASHLAALRKAERKVAEVTQAARDVLPLKIGQLESQQDVLRRKRDGLEQARHNIDRRQADADKNFQLAQETRDLEKRREAEELERLELEAGNAEDTFALWEAELKTNRRLRERGVVSDLQLLSVRRSRDQAEATVRKNESLIRESEQARDIAGKKFAALQMQYQQTLSDLQEEKSQNQIATEAVVAELKQRSQEQELLSIESQRELELARFEEEQAREAIDLSFRGVSPDVLKEIVEGTSGATSQTLLKAPVDGTIGKLFIRHGGEGVTRGQTVMTLIPAGVALQAEIRISNRDIGRMHPGLEVRLKFDAFPHAEHGHLVGELTEIVPEAEFDSDADAGRTASFYRAYCSLSTASFRVEGEVIPLLPGMTATAEIVTERKTLLTMLLKPFTELRDSQAAQP